ncbi:MAG: acyl transferase [Saprospiraceae bacterium]
MDKFIAQQSWDENDFEKLTLDVFAFQAQYNEVYKKYITLLNRNISSVKKINDIPFLPVELFKNHSIKTGKWEAQKMYRSSNTTSTQSSQHFIRDEQFYLRNAWQNFLNQYPQFQKGCIIGLLPSYLERNDASLVAMVNYFMQQTKNLHNGFYLNEWKKLDETINTCISKNVPTLLFGVTFALLEWVQNSSVDKLNNNIIIMETGGMKGRKSIMPRFEVHNKIKTRFALQAIHSEYGMTELFSQAYAKSEGIFQPCNTMKVLPREVNDPLSIAKFRKNAALNIIDLLNIDTCSFIATEDVGKVYENGDFEVSGRLDAADIRGCNLMVI